MTIYRLCVMAAHQHRHHIASSLPDLVHDPGVGRVRGRYVDFYWTLPVPFAAFTALPDDIDAAAVKSMTVRYQRERVRRWVKDRKGELCAERAFLELSPDRGTPEGAAAAETAIALARSKGAELVLVDFSLAFGWRTHPALRERLDAADVPWVALPPEPIPIDKQVFDPNVHFRTWDQTLRAFRASKPERKVAVLAALGSLPVEEMTYAEIAGNLNGAGITTVTGKTWTKDSVRKFMAMP